MKIFGLEFGKKEIKNDIGQQAFSTPFQPIGGNNLSSPYINSNYTVNDYVMFGGDNLYPQLLVQLYLQSALNGACIDFIYQSVIGGGYEWDNENITAVEKVEIKTFEKKNGFKKMVKSITKDWIIHRRVCIEVIVKNKKVEKVRRIDPVKIRNNADKSVFVFSNDWSSGLVNSKRLEKFHWGCKDGSYMLYFEDEVPGQDIYPIPTYNSILNWAFLDNEQAFFHKSNLQNGIFPSLAVRRPKNFGSIEEMRQFKEEIGSKTGASNAGRVLVLTGNGFDDTPEIQAISSNNNDKLFLETSKEIKENICIGHKINPSIMGVKVAGQLGNTTEIKDSYLIFEKNVVMPERASLEDIFNEIIEVCDIKNTISINNYQIIDAEIKIKEE